MKPGLVKFRSDKLHTCRYCAMSKPSHLLTEPDGCETRVCQDCGKRLLKKFKRKIKKTLKSKENSQDLSSQHKISQNHTQKKQEKPIQKELSAFGGQNGN